MGNLFRGTRLAADPISSYITTGSCAFFHVLTENIDDHVTGLLGNHLPAIAGISGLHNVAVLIHDPIHHMRSHQITAIGDGRRRGDHMDGGDTEVLSERFHSQVGSCRHQLTPRCGTVWSPLLAGQYRCFLSNERFTVLGRRSPRPKLADMNGPRVTGVVQAFPERLCAMARVIPAADGVIPTRNRDTAGTGKGAVL